jgi:hypothetical protein
VDAAGIQAKVSRGYAIAASKLGLPFSVYRATGPMDPVSRDNLMGSLPAAFSAQNADFSRPPGFKDNGWRAYVDSSQTQAGDYLVEVVPTQTGAEPRTFYILSQQPLSPISAAMCHATMSFARPGTPIKDASGYSTPGPAATILANWPCSLVAGTKGEKSDSGLVRDTRNPWYAVTLPDVGVEIRTDDIATDALGHRYLVSSAERSDLGWRLSIQYVGA